MVYRVYDVGGEQQVEPLRRSQPSASARLCARLGALARAALRLGCQLRRLDALLRAELFAAQLRLGGRLVVPVEQRHARAARAARAVGVVRARAALHRA